MLENYREKSALADSWETPDLPNADCICVFSGTTQRIMAGLLMHEKTGLPLMISSYRALETLEELDPELLELLGPDSDSNIFWDLEATNTRDTVGNLQAWMTKKGLKTPAIVTENFHMPRTKIELNKTDLKDAFVPVSVNDALGGEINRKVRVLEPIKCIAAKLGLGGIHLPEAI